jgi:ribosomal-protein-alanine N-acetyltransferase
MSFPGPNGVVIRRILPTESITVARLFSESAAAPWDVESLVQLENFGGSIWIATGGDEIAGAVASRHIVDEAEILNLAVARAWRRRGIGRWLIETILDRAASAGVRRVFLEVRESNAGACAFYRCLGFVEIGRRRGYYSHPVEDALLLSRTL